MKNPHTPNLTWIGSWWHKIWPQEYLISPIEISANWPGSIYTDFNGGLIRYSCSHISGPHEPVPTKFGLWMFVIMLHRYMVSKMLKCKKSFLWCHRFCTLWGTRHTLQSQEPELYLTLRMDDVIVHFWPHLWYLCAFFHANWNNTHVCKIHKLIKKKIKCLYNPTFTPQDLDKICIMLHPFSKWDKVDII